jgi:hypothetical protein
MKRTKERKRIEGRKGEKDVHKYECESVSEV